MISKFLDATIDYRRTSSVEFLEDHSVTFVRNKKFLSLLYANAKNIKVVTLMPKEMKEVVATYSKEFRKRVRPAYVNDVDKIFVYYHNMVNAARTPKRNEISEDAYMEPNVWLAEVAMKYIYSIGMSRPILMKHMGNIVIEGEVKIYNFATIHRASLGSTVIETGVQIGPYCNVGHNVLIRKNTILTPQVCLGGSSRIGENCFIGMGTIVRDGVHICSGVKIGMGSLVVKDINSPGLYFGSPAERKGTWNGIWHK
jgi:UDP-3-O-[3-hydroxymyristoyl] glucosamine N-acyltransferase